MKMYHYVWPYVCFCLQSSIYAANVIVGFPRSQKKTSSVFIGTNAAPHAKRTHVFFTGQIWLWSTFFQYKQHTLRTEGFPFMCLTIETVCAKIVQTNSDIYFDGFFNAPRVKDFADTTQFAKQTYRNMRHILFSSAASSHFFQLCSGPLPYCSRTMNLRVLHLPQLSPILLLKILRLCLTIKLTGKKLDSSIFELAQAN